MKLATLFLFLAGCAAAQTCGPLAYNPLTQQFDCVGVANSSAGPPLGASGSFSVVRTNGSTLSIGPACTTAVPCSFSFGTDIYTLTSATRTAVISAGTDTAYIYLTPAGVLTVGTSSQTVTCTGCTATTGITSFPATSLALWTWTSTSGVWATGGTDQRTIVQKARDAQMHAIQFQMGDGTNVITTGDLNKYASVDYECTVVRVDTVGSPAGNFTMDLWKRNGALPTSSQKMSASAPPTLSGATVNLNGSRTGWTNTVNVGDIFGGTIVTATTVTSVSVVVWCQ